MPDQRADVVGPVGDGLGLALRGDGVVEAVAGGEVDRLQHAVHGPADRRAVAALQPRRQVEVARPLLRARRSSSLVGGRAPPSSVERGRPRCVGRAATRLAERGGRARPAPLVERRRRRSAAAEPAAAVSGGRRRSVADGVGQVVEPLAHAVDQQLGVGALASARARLRARLAVERHDEVVAAPGCRRRRAGGCARRSPSARRSGTTASNSSVTTLRRSGSRPPPSGGKHDLGRRAAGRCGPVDMPDTIVIGNSRPLAAWIVMIRTASSSVSGSTASATRAPSARLLRRPSAGTARRLPPVASLHARAWSMTKRSRRHTSRGRPSAKPSSKARRSRAMRSSSSDGRVPVARARAARAGRRGPAARGRRRARCRAGRRCSSSGRRRSTLKRNRSSSPQPSSGVRRAATMREVVGGVVDRPQHHEQVAHGPGGVDERARLGPVRDAGRRQGVLESGRCSRASPRRRRRYP